jgi:hypothetical protein
LKDESNSLEIELAAPLLQRKGNILDLEFSYCLPLESVPYWRIASFLENAEVEQVP